MPTISMPWCSSGSIIDSSVLSWPPCWVEVEVNTPAGLPDSTPDIHSAAVPSRKYLSGAAMLPKRVGLPMTRPAQSRRSVRSTYGGPSPGAAGGASAPATTTGGTVRTRAAMPSTSATPRATCRASSAVAPWRL